MKGIIKILSFIIIILITSRLYCTDTSTIKYLPLKTGNVWVYYGISVTPLSMGRWYDRYDLKGASSINGKIYFLVDHFRRIINVGQLYTECRLFGGSLPIRIDSNTLNIYQKDSCGLFAELLVDSLRSKKNDTAIIECNYVNNFIICADTSLYNIFGSPKPSKRFWTGWFEVQNEQTYVKNIGLVLYLFSQHTTSSQIILQGCLIDGILYGDTSTLAGIRQISYDVASSFTLSQNYPNPFNPTTKIKFSIRPPLNPLLGKEGTLVSLLIFDVLGRKIEVLVNENLKPGSYEVEWNGSNYPSGVYLYKLTTADYTDSKKLVLLK